MHWCWDHSLYAKTEHTKKEEMCRPTVLSNIDMTNLTLIKNELRTHSN